MGERRDGNSTEQERGEQPRFMVQTAIDGAGKFFSMSGPVYVHLSMPSDTPGPTGILRSTTQYCRVEDAIRVIGLTRTLAEIFVIDQFFSNVAEQRSCTVVRPSRRGLLDAQKEVEPTRALRASCSLRLPSAGTFASARAA